MANEEDVTVIVATYEHSKYLKECIDSIQRQTLRCKTIVVSVSGDAKTDEVMHRNIQNWFNLDWIHSDVRNSRDQRNLGLEATKTPLVSFFDSDDKMRPNKMEVEAKACKGQVCPIAYTRFQYVDASLNRIMSPKHLAYRFIQDHRPWTLERMLNGCVIPDQSIVRTSELKAIGGFQDAEHPLQDEYDYLRTYAMWLRLLKRIGAEVVPLKKVGWLYRQLSESQHSTRYSSPGSLEAHRQRMKEVAMHYFPEGARTNLSNNI